MKIISNKDIDSEIIKGLARGSIFDVVLYEYDEVNYGFDEKPDFEYCKQHNIVCHDIGRRGGAFYISKGDVAIGYICQGLDNSFGEKIMAKFVNYLKSKGLEAELNNNDILINRYKVTSWASNYFKEYDAIFITVHFTMSVNLEAIRAVCTKEMVKIPKGLNEYNISQNNILDFIKEVSDEQL